MKKTLISLSLLASFALAGCARTETADSDVETAVRTFAQAFRAGDFEAVESLVAEDYVHVNSGAEPYDRAQWLGWYEGYAEEIADGDHIFHEYEIQSLKIALHDDAAYVAGVVNASGERSGSPFSQRIRFTNLWIVEDGRWKRAGFHDVAAAD